MLAVVALHVVPAALFALIHGAIFYRTRSILAFITLCFVIGNIFENVGVRTGFPYGHYYFTDLMGPRLFVVPILLGLAYVGMAYLSWTLARLILGVRKPLIGSRIVTLPLVAAFIQLFALYLRWSVPSPKRLSSSYWHLAVVFYAVSATGNLLLAIPQPGPRVISDPAGVQWKVSDITGACPLVSIFLMGAFAVLAWIRLGDQNAEGARSLAEPPETGLGKAVL
jgi:putative membrane protein